MSASGRITHCEVFVLAGQKKATKGKAGLWALAFRSGKAISLLADGDCGVFFLFLALFDEEGATILKCTWNDSQRNICEVTESPKRVRKVEVPNPIRLLALSAAVASH